MSDRNALAQQMLANNTKLLERFIKEGNQEKIQEYQQRVDKLRAQLDDGSGAVSNNPQYSHGGYAAPAANPQPAYNPQPTYTPTPNPQPAYTPNPQPTYQPPAATTPTYQPPAPSTYNPAPANPQPTYQPTNPAPYQPTAPSNQPYNPPANPTYTPSQTNYYQPPASEYSSANRELLAKDMEMQEMKLTNARLRDQLAQKEETHANDSRNAQKKTNEMNQKIQELLLAQQNFDAQLHEKQANIDALQRQRADADSHRALILSEQTLKSDQLIGAKEMEVAEKARQVQQANAALDQLAAQLASNQEATNFQVQSLEDEKSRLNEALDHARSQLKQKQEQLETLHAELLKVKREQEDEANQVGIFVSKSLSAIKLATTHSNEQETKGRLVLTSKSNLGFAELTIQQVIKEKPQ